MLAFGACLTQRGSEHASSRNILGHSGKSCSPGWSDSTLRPPTVQQTGRVRGSQSTSAVLWARTCTAATGAGYVCVVFIAMFEGAAKQRAGNNHCQESCTVHYEHSLSQLGSNNLPLLCPIISCGVMLPHRADTSDQARPPHMAAAGLQAPARADLT